MFTIINEVVIRQKSIKNAFKNVITASVTSLHVHEMVYQLWNDSELRNISHWLLLGRNY